jgi:DNA-binding LytR/AlgR family response regulator
MRPGADAAAERPQLAEERAGAEQPPTAGNVVDLGQGTFGPLGGAGGPPRRTAQQLPIERDGGTHFVPVDDVVAVHANAHYTYIFDGKTKLFCSLPIGVVESRLDASRFVRVHRSHIVAIDRIVGLKRVGETGLIELAALEPYTVPVSRGRLAWLKSRLAVTTGDPGPSLEPTLAMQHR